MENENRIFQNLINQGEKFDSSQYPLARNMAEGHDYMENYPPEFDSWAMKVKSSILELFNKTSYEATLVNDAFKDYKSFKTYKNRSTLDRIQHLLIEALKSASNSKAKNKQRNKIQNSVIQKKGTRKKVFIVHGHDIAARETMARFIAKLELEPVILHEQPNLGKTIIEKFEANAEVCYAVILLTPDDEGGKKGDNDLKERARQNVILELGYFMGKLGRENVCAIYKDNVEVPSDILGVLYLPLDNSDGWKLKLATEMKAAGLNFDINSAV